MGGGGWGIGGVYGLGYHAASDQSTTSTRDIERSHSAGVVPSVAPSGSLFAVSGRENSDDSTGYLRVSSAVGGIVHTLPWFVLSEEEFYFLSQ